ncbi:hypothetical protein AAL_05394 [Moelleriella libera RCEF 2490]|uniref:Complex 1 LYR protein n=1 Tax=Moelleriella libera RCEF 2490 TaxID=1081109 RepID=A0A168AAB4_9HYPO|nr:hypothetical protein AAL_05394 [Moelleriella libera RCEF 2490]
MSRAIARRIYADALANWPKQDLRPDYQLQDVLRAAVEQRYKTMEPALENEEILKARALQFLVQNKYNERAKASAVQAQRANALATKPTNVFPGSDQRNRRGTKENMVGASG